MFLGDLWNTYLYEPMFNVLIWLYNNWAKESFAVAVILLTVGIRLVLLPFSIISERNKVRYDRLQESMDRIKKDFKNDLIAQREAIRKAFKEEKVSPWAKAIMIIVLALSFLLLYQVFIRGLTGERLNILYSWNFRPGKINTDFLGWDISKHSIVWPAIVALVLFIEITLKQWPNRSSLTRPDLLYRILFPFFTAFLLWLLPMVKSIFILTSLSFSYFLMLLRRIFFPPEKSHPAKAKH